MSDCAGSAFAETTAAKQRGRPFKPGQSGNPGGRPKGARNKLTEILLLAVANDFAEHGSETLARLRANDPGAYLKVVSSLVPKELILEREQAPEVDLADLTSAELNSLLDAEHRRRFIQYAVSLVDGRQPPQSLFERREAEDRTE